MRTVRVYADGLRRITEAESQLYRDRMEQPMLDSGMPLAEAMRAASVFGAEWNTAGDASLLALYHRHQESDWLSGMVARIEETLEQLGVYRRLARPPAMVFLDLVGYARLTERRGDAAAAGSRGQPGGPRAGGFAAAWRAAREVARRDHVPFP